MKSNFIILLFSAIFSGCAHDNDTPAPPTENPGETAVFFDDFNSFDPSSWTKETHEAGWTNRELQSYSSSQVTVGKDGDKSVLIITAKRINGKIISGRINSKNKRTFKNGKIEARIKLPKTADGLWPAFWMMGNNNRQWPACGEIDIMEMGDAQGIADGTSSQRVNTAIHYGENADSHEQQYFTGNAAVDLQDGNYHTYSLTRTDNTLKIAIDDQYFHTFDITSNPYFQDNFYILFNLAVGGSFTGITDIQGITALNEGQKAEMYIDWVRVTD